MKLSESQRHTKQLASPLHHTKT